MTPNLDFGKNMVFFFGRVEDRMDPLRIGRVRVRIFAYHNDDPNMLATDLLPWAMTLQGIVSAATNGVGMSPTGLVEGSTVFGVFLDGSYAQQPFVLGPYAGAPDGISDVSKLADGSEKLDKGTAPFEPSDAAKAQYPFNKVFTSENGHVIEVDDTPGAERMNMFHKQGSYYEMRPDGSVIRRAATDDYDITLNNKTIYVGKNATIHVANDASIVVGGRADISAVGAIGLTSEKAIKLLAPDIRLLEVSADVNAEISGSHTLMARESYVAAYDDNLEEAPDSVKEMYPLETEDGGLPTKEAEVRTQKKSGKPTLCLDIDVPGGVVRAGHEIYSKKLSSNFTIGSLTTSAVFPHVLREQQGLSVDDIVCNLKALSENILEPLRARFPGFRINSGFRKGSGSSQHCRGQAADMQWPGASSAKYLEIAHWMAENLPVDQLILEHGNSMWIHVSYNKQNRSQRGNLLTMVNQKYTPGLKLYR